MTTPISTLSEAELDFLKPYLVDYVAAGVHAHLQNATPEITQARQVAQLDLVVTAYPELSPGFTAA